VAELWLHWQDSPPVHISVAALLRSWGAKPAQRAAAPPASPDSSQPTTSAMEAVAALLGPPAHPFRPPCRMQAPALPPTEGPLP
jgi:hypothetical protein